MQSRAPAMAPEPLEENPPHVRTGEPSSSVPDERDAVIKRLERALAEERDNAAALRETVDSLRFKADVLEKSYATQLADVRKRLAQAEQMLAEQQARSAEFGGDHEETAKLLGEARVEIRQLTLERDQLRRELRSGGWRAPQALADDQGAVEPQADEGTINQLMSNAGWLSKPESAAGDSHLSAQVVNEPDAPIEQMIDPELVFTQGRDSDGDT